MFQVMWQALTNQSRVTTLPIAGRPLLLRGFVCAYHPAAGSNPKHTILVFYKKNFAFDSTTTKLEAARRVMDILCI